MREKVIGKVCLSEATDQNPYYDEYGTLIIIGFRVSRSVCLRLPLSEATAQKVSRVRISFLITVGPCSAKGFNRSGLDLLMARPENICLGLRGSRTQALCLGPHPHLLGV